MCKFVLIVSLFVTLLLILFFPEGSGVSAVEVSRYVGWVKRSEPIIFADHVSSKMLTKKTDSCTERCHINFMAYDNKFDVTQRAEVFRHKTHSFEQNLDCTSCHNNSEVNTERHGKLTIKKEDCLKCHHVELEGSKCQRCHQDIDENSMKYKEEKFVHGFTVESGVDCGLCHIKDPNASLKKEKINCVKCHHTTPDLDCVKCHKDDIDRYFNTDLQRRDSLSWSVSFRHSQHPERDLSCKECHSISHENDTGIVEYNLNCSKCHHISEEKRGCVKCHKEPFAYFRGEIGINEITPMPDMMSRAVKCEDCHRYNDKKLKFRGVEKYCMECHNEDYGKLYNAWNNTIENRLRKFNYRVQTLIEDGNIHYINKPAADGDRNLAAGEPSDQDTFIEKIDRTIDLITKYGTHNFNLTKLLLDYLEGKIMSYHGKNMEP